MYISMAMNFHTCTNTKKQYSTNNRYLIEFDIFANQYNDV